MLTILIKNKNILTAVLFFCGSANALTIETVAVTANRIAKPLSEHSVSISIIDQQLAQIGHTHISEALAQVPGVWVSRGNGQEHLTAIRSPVLTGAGSCGAFHFAEDNIPLRAPGFCNVNALFDVNSEQAERVEVIRGAGTALHGSNAVNGVINVISLPPSQEPSAALAVEVGAEDYQRLKFSRSETGGRHGYRLSVQGSKDRGYKDDAGFDQQKINLRHTYDGEIWQINSQLSASNLNQETASYILGENSYRDSAKQRENPSPEAFRDSHSVRYYSRFERDGSNNSHFVVTPYMRYTSMDFLQHFLPGTPLEENGERSAGVQTAFYQTISDATTLHHGFDLEITDAYLQQTQDSPGFAVFPSGKHYDYQVDGRYLAWFLGSVWEVSDGSVLNLDARYENQHYQYKNN
ncbi:MAG: TonB-dependent receptor, partial [Spongiibacteraceae bacterium]